MSQEKTPKANTQSVTISTVEVASSLRKINTLLGSDDTFSFNEAVRILAYISSPQNGESQSYPNVGKMSMQLLMTADTLDTLGDIDIMETTDTLKKVLTRTLHPVVKLYGGIY